MCDRWSYAALQQQLTVIFGCCYCWQGVKTLFCCVCCGFTWTTLTLQWHNGRLQHWQTLSESLMQRGSRPLTASGMDGSD